MGCWDIFCCICGNTCQYDYFKRNLKNILKLDDKIDIDIILKNLKWINNCTILTVDNKVIHNCKEIACNITFSCNKKRYSAWVENEVDYFSKIGVDNRGIFIHTDCWKFVKINYDIELKYKHLPIYANCIDLKCYHIPLNIDYGEISKYWKQEMDYYNMYLDNNIYMINSPLVLNSKNITRIKKIITQLKLKKEIRPSPPVSATFYKNSIIKLGDNNKFWIIKNSRWNELKDDVIKKSFNFDRKFKDKLKINKIPQIGEFNNVPLFVNKWNVDKKITQIEFIGTQKSLDKII